MAKNDFRPMLADTLDPKSLHTLRFPLLASPKMDGIRCVIRGGKALSRSLKAIPNTAVRTFLEAHPGLEGLDGELMVAGASFQEVSSTFMTRAGKLPDQWYFGVFDAIPLHPTEPYFERYARAVVAVSAVKTDNHVVIVPQSTLETLPELEGYEGKALELGFEGVMLRRGSAHYKFGRSRVGDGALLKLKRFADAEAEVIGLVELLHNGNEATTNELGLTKRSTAKSGKSGSGMMGALRVKDITTGVVFEIGTGYTDAQRRSFWSEPEAVLGRVVKYKHFVTGSLNKPRFPVFIGFRAAEDM